ncbi:MAG: beta-N-acetylhexosaminidase [Gammaproteobacteria bacterium]|nr:beta-N-acetylhexosaminidase [Gammaproteobacteria bacterium]
MSLGSVMIDLEGTSISEQERKLLSHPQTAGVVLFPRNFQSISQIQGLIKEIRELRDPHLLIAIDHDGEGIESLPVGFTHFPTVRELGIIYENNEFEGSEFTEKAGWLFAAELRSIGIDFSFYPGLDLDHDEDSYDECAFHYDAEFTAVLACSFMKGMSKAGMQAVGKHFPGYGGVSDASSDALPVDNRDMATLNENDLHVFKRVLKKGLPAIVATHILYQSVDSKPAAYSTVWLTLILRDELGFKGVVISDDLSMKAAAVAGSYSQRARLALKAGCDMVLVCNNPAGAAEVLKELEGHTNLDSQDRLKKMYGKSSKDYDALRSGRHWKKASKIIADVHNSAWLEMKHNQYG